jgi:methenyltetrahydrofolate cyclohydrolase
MRDQTMSAFLDQLAARVPAPGGGATAALQAAQSAALLAMVGRYSNAPTYDAKLMGHIIAETDELRNDALTLAEADEDAFAAVAEAYRLPKETSEQRMDRSEAIAAAQAEASRPPADVIRLALLLVSFAEELLTTGNRNMITDVAAAAAGAPAAPGTAPVINAVKMRGHPAPAGRGAVAAPGTVKKRRASWWGKMWRAVYV